MLTVHKDDNDNVFFRERVNEFVATLGGADVFWVLYNYKDDNEFIITKEDEYWYSVFNLLFDMIKKNDDRFTPAMKENTFEWISEAYGIPEEAHRLRITKEEKQYKIKFIKGLNMMFNTCPICFCGSGSRYPRISQLFTVMYSRLCEIGKDYSKVNYKKILGTNSLKHW